MAESRSRGTLALKIVVLGEGKFLHTIDRLKRTHVSLALRPTPNSQSQQTLRMP